MLLATHSPDHETSILVGIGKTITRSIVDTYAAGKSFKTLEIQADGDELELILSKCKNLPFVTDKRVMTWTGDFAQFIADNVIF
jgi:hypothetical protein